jgi:hypothetical protein
LSRLEVLAIPICLCIPFDSCIWQKVIDVLNDIFALFWIFRFELLLRKIIQVLT